MPSMLTASSVALAFLGLIPSTLATSWSSSCSASSAADSQLLAHPYPLEYPPLNADPQDKFPMPKCNGFKLHEATIDQIQNAFDDGRLTITQLAQCYVQRITQVNEWTKSIVEINPDYLAIAAKLDYERRKGKCRGPLHGIPFVVKENIGTKDKMETTGGSWMLLGSVIPRDAHVVKRLRESGALLLGKATMSEWADMRSNGYSEGYSARAGQARSPYNFTVNPGGSSTGSATSIAANMAVFSLGTETDGSVINPAMRNSLVGIKPTVGLTSRAGVIPESSHQDSVGTFARTVRDAVYALDAIYGIDTRDNYTTAQSGHTPTRGYSQYLATRHALKGAVFGLPWASFWQYADADNLASLHALLPILESHGATILNNTELPNRDLLVSPSGWDWDYGTKRGYKNESEYTVVKVDFFNDITSYLSELSNTNIRSLADIVAYNVANTGTEGGVPGSHPAFESGQDGFDAALATGGVRDEIYFQALEFCQRQSRELGIDAALKTVVGGRKPHALLVPPDVGQSYQVAAQAGYPVVTIPTGVHAATGMGFGLAFMGTAWSESVLIRLASATEDALRRSRDGWGRHLPRWGEYTARNVPVYWDV